MVSRTVSSVFLDSSFIKAIVDPDDDFSPLAIRLWDSLIANRTPLLTTNYILDECFTLVRIKCSLKKAMDMRQILADNTHRIKYIRVTVADDAGAWTWFKNDWSHLSFTDCVSFAVMKRLGLTDVATFDGHFAQAGFRALGDVHWGTVLEYVSLTL